MEDNRLNLRSLFYNAFSKTMEKMAYEEVEFTDSDRLSADEDEYMWASLSVVEPFSSDISIALPFEFAEELTGAIYGEDMDELSPQDVNDSIAEILNTVAGGFLSEIIPADQEFTLGLPNTGMGTRPETEPGDINISFYVNGHIVKSTISGDEIKEFCN